MKALVTGATGFVGGRLADALDAAGHDVRAMVRDKNKDAARKLSEKGFGLHEGDVLKPSSLEGAGEGVDVAYYLIHSMGRGSGDDDFEVRERKAAKAFARMASDEGVGRVVYLGGLGDKPESKHLRSRHETAQILEAEGPPLTYFRASMVIGPGSESFLMLKHLVKRLPMMIAPAWLSIKTQPIAADDVIAYLAAAPEVEEAAGREVQIGAPDQVTYGDLLDLMAEALDVRARPRLPVPFVTPWLSSKWIGLVTPVDAGVARPLIEGLSTPTIVTDPSGAELFDIEPLSVREALRGAVAEAEPAAAAPA